MTRCCWWLIVAALAVGAVLALRLLIGANVLMLMLTGPG